MASKEIARSRGDRTEERCTCGRKITPLAKRLQAANPGLQRKCFSCLTKDREIRIVTL